MVDVEDGLLGFEQKDSIKIIRNSRGYNYELKMLTIDLALIEAKMNEVEVMIAKRQGK